MFKYMKYELRGTYKFMVGIIIAFIGATTGIQLFVNNQINDTRNRFLIDITPLLFTAFIFIMFGALIAATIFIISSYRKELYEDRGYLTFTLPLTGSQILGSKLTIAMFWFISVSLVVTIYNGVLGLLLFGDNWLRQLQKVFSSMVNVTISTGTSTLLSSILTLLLIYFSITLSRVTLKNKKIGGIWFLIFIVLNSLLTYLFFKISSLIPVYIDLFNLRIVTASEAEMLYGHMTNIVNGTGAYFSAVTGEVLISLSSLIFTIIVSVGLFLGTSYLIEKKIDL